MYAFPQAENRALGFGTLGLVELAPSRENLCAFRAQLSALGSFTNNLGREFAGAADFFIFFARNPLKRPDSEKEMKGNESFFPFISFPFLSFT